MKTHGISGTAVAAVAAGGFLLWTGITGQPVIAGLRNLVEGRPASRLRTGSAFPVRSSAGTSVAGSGELGARIAAQARQGEGVMYRWGGDQPSGWDCSGFVSYVLRQVGAMTGRRVSGQFLVWTGATTISRSQTGPGDLLCWAGHVAIALSPTQMIEAPGRGKRTRITSIRWTGCTVRRVKG